MTLKELRHKFDTGLKSLYPKEEIASFFQLLAHHQLSMSRIGLATKTDLVIEGTDLDFFLNAFAELEQEKPIQYIIGKTEFFGLPFIVTKDVLIPRPETEELVDWIIKETKHRKEDLKILDIGTGSGCIPVALAKNLPNAEVFALDISAEALAIAKQNSELNNVTVNFIQQDILNTDVILSGKRSQKFDIIVSNPPYVLEDEKKEIKANVLDNEPHLALFVNNDNPLLFYNKIADLAKSHLTKDCLLFFEINQYLGTETVDLLRQKGFTTIELRKDLFSNDRMVKASY